VCRWLAGDSADRCPPADPARLAVDLARFVAALRAVDTGGRAAVTTGRGSMLSTVDGEVRAALRDCAALADTERLARTWDDCFAAEAYRGPGVWLHADLMPGNLLLRDGAPAAVVDLGTVRVGDPALDLMPAWNLFDAPARARYRDALGVDDQSWRRGGAGRFCRRSSRCPTTCTTPAMADTARHTLAALLAE
jgi:aminoglycoside phosphotransferase (APT) family kinase protein